MNSVKAQAVEPASKLRSGVYTRYLRSLTHVLPKVSPKASQVSSQRSGPVGVASPQSVATAAKRVEQFESEREEMERLAALWQANLPATVEACSIAGGKHHLPATVEASPIAEPATSVSASSSPNADASLNEIEAEEAALIKKLAEVQRKRLFSGTNTPQPSHASSSESLVLNCSRELLTSAIPSSNSTIPSPKSSVESPMNQSNAEYLWLAAEKESKRKEEKLRREKEMEEEKLKREKLEARMRREKVQEDKIRKEIEDKLRREKELEEEKLRGEKEMEDEKFKREKEMKAEQIRRAKEQEDKIKKEIEEKLRREKEMEDEMRRQKEQEEKFKKEIEVKLRREKEMEEEKLKREKEMEAEKIRREKEQEDKIKKEIEEKLRREREEEDKFKRGIEEKVRREREERLKKEVEEKVRKELEVKIRQEEEDRWRREEEKLKKEIEDRRRSEERERGERERQRREELKKRIIYDCWVYKRGAGGLVHSSSYRKRYFVITDQQRLQYFEDPDDYYQNRAKGWLSCLGMLVKDHTGTETIEGKVCFTFTIQAKEGSRTSEIQCACETNDGRAKLLATIEAGNRQEMCMEMEQREAAGRAQQDAVEEANGKQEEEKSEDLVPILGVTEPQHEHQEEPVQRIQITKLAVPAALRPAAPVEAGSAHANQHLGTNAAKMMHEASEEEEEARNIDSLEREVATVLNKATVLNQEQFEGEHDKVEKVEKVERIRERVKRQEVELRGEEEILKREEELRKKEACEMERQSADEESVTEDMADSRTDMEMASSLRALPFSPPPPTALLPSPIPSCTARSTPPRTPMLPLSHDHARTPSTPSSSAGSTIMPSSAPSSSIHITTFSSAPPPTSSATRAAAPATRENGIYREQVESRRCEDAQMQEEEEPSHVHDDIKNSAGDHNILRSNSPCGSTCGSTAGSLTGEKEKKKKKKKLEEIDEEGRPILLKSCQIRGDAIEGEKITAFAKRAKKIEISCTFQWYRVSSGSEDIVAGADKASYVMCKDDVGHRLKVVGQPIVKETNENGQPVTATTTEAVIARATPDKTQETNEVNAVEDENDLPRLTDWKIEMNPRQEYTDPIRM